MAAGSRRTLLGAALTVLIVSISSALPAGRRSGSTEGLDKFISRNQLLSTEKKEMQDDEAFVRQLTELVEQLNSKRSRSDGSAAAYRALELKSRDQDHRRAAFDDEDPLHILLGNERPDSTRDHKDSRAMEDLVKRKPLQPVANERSDVIRAVGRNAVGGSVSNDQRQLRKLNRPSRQEFLYAIGAAERPSYGGGDQTFLKDFPYGSPTRDSTDNSDSNDYGYEYEWIECEENDPDCEEKH